MNEEHPLNKIASTWIEGIPVWLRVLTWAGFPIIVAIVMTSVALGWLRSPTTVNQAVHETAMQAMGDRVIIIVKEHEVAAAKRDIDYIGLLRQICRNTAPTPVERVGCGR